MKAILPAAGYATRMHPLTLDRPKALLKVNRKEILSYVLDKVLEIGNMDGIYVVSNDKFYNHFLEWSRNYNSNLIKIVNDETSNNKERLGTIGDINYVLKNESIKDDILVVNTDNLFNFDLKEMYHSFMSKKASVIGIYNVGDFNVAKKMGAVKLSDEGKVSYFKEKDPYVDSCFCSIGIYFFNKEVVDIFDDYLDKGNSPDKSGEFIEWLYKRKPVFGFVFNKEKDKWMDIGSIEGYEKAKTLWNG